MLDLTHEQLMKMAPRLATNQDRAITIAALVTDLFPKYGMTSVNLGEECLATLIEETGDFTSMVESTDYSAARMAVVWPNRYAVNPKAAKKIPNALALSLAHHPQLFANTVYANRLGNGNVASGDGYRFRGGGFMQLTFRKLYALYGQHIGKTAEEAADLVQTGDWYAMDSACWYFVNQAHLLDESEKNDFVTITKVVNGGLTNWATRQDCLGRVKKYWV